MFLKKGYTFDWENGEIEPQHINQISYLQIPDCLEYVKNIISDAGCTDRASLLKLYNCVLIIIQEQLESDSSMNYLYDEVMQMYKIIRNRKDYNFQMLINALSYFDDKGIAMGSGLAELLESLPQILIPCIRNGEFNKKPINPRAKRNWETGDIVRQSSDVPFVAIPEFAEYVDSLIHRAGCQGIALPLEVLIGVIDMIQHILFQEATFLDIGDEVSQMLEQLISREDCDFQMFVDALSYFGVDGVNMGKKLNNLLENKLPELIIPAIRDGIFNQSPDEDEE